MSQLRVEHTVSAPADEVWAALANFGAIHRFHPGVESSPITNGQPSGVGARRTCHFYDGGSADEEIVEIVEGREMVVAVLEGPLPAHDIAATFSVEPLEPNVTRVSISMSYRPKFGPLGALMNAAMIRPKMRGLLFKVLEGLAAHVETGALVGKGGVVAAAA